MLLGILLTGGTGVAVYLGSKLRNDKKRAALASKSIKAELEAKRQRDEIRRNWENEHILFSDEAFTGYAHFSVNIGGTTVSCPKCKEL